MSLPTILTPTYSGSPRSKGFPKKGIVLPTNSNTYSSIAPFQDDQTWKLFITTSCKVCVWDHQSCGTVFTSASEGIVAAKRAKDGSALAVADSQVVMLHKIEDGQDKSYRLKGTQRCRLLQYDHDSRSLFFTDSIHHSVQTYSIKENRVAEAAKGHPSSITAFAISCDSNLILSCSSDPPIIQIHNRLLVTTVSISPRASSAPVATCTFHPTRRHIFVLAFGDGVLAAYDYSKISGGSKAKKDGKVGVGQGGVKEIHAFRHLHDPSISGSAGITGVQFVPGHRSRAVTVGEDGRLFLLDFETPATLGSWHIGAPATALSIRPAASVKENEKGKRNAVKPVDLGGFLIAVGTAHGRCYVYDGYGNKIGDQTIDLEGGKILDVEWVSGAIHIPQDLASNLSSPGSLSNARSSSPLEPSDIGRQHAAHVSAAGNPKSKNDKSLLDISLVPPSEPSTRNEDWGLLNHTASEGYMKLFSPVKKRNPAKAASLPEKNDQSSEQKTDPKLRTVQKEDQRSAISAPLLWNQKNDFPMVDSPEKTDPDETITSLTSTVNQTSKSEGNAAGMDQSMIGLHRVTSMPSDTVKFNERARDGQLLSEIRSIRARVSNGPRGNLSLFASFMPGKLKTGPIARKQGNYSIMSEDKSDVSLDVSRTQKTQDGTAKIREESIKEQIDGGDNETESLRDHKEIASEETKLEEDVEDGEEEDIWLIQGKKERNIKKRKKSIAEEEIGDVAQYSSRSISKSGSSKSRKTVSWDNRRSSRGEEEVESSITNEGTRPFSVPAISSTKASRGSSIHSNDHRLGDISGMSDKSLFKADIDKKNLPENSHLEGSFYTPSEGKLPSAPTITGAGLDPTLRDALVELQMAMKIEVGNIQTEMLRQFYSQKRTMESLKDEMAKVREENEKLRGQLFELSGIRERVKSNGSFSP
ncbi:hypothetical protein RUND412_010841 [Rhizina undulata]